MKVKNKSFEELFAGSINNTNVVNEEHNGYADQLVVGGRQSNITSRETLRNIRNMSVLEIIA